MFSWVAANLLDEQLVANRYTPEQLDNLKKLVSVKAVLLESLIDVKHSHYGILPSSEEYLPPGKGVGLVRGGDLGYGHIRFPEVFAPLSYATKRGTLRLNDVLVLAKGACIDGPAGVGLVTQNTDGLIFNGTSYRIRMNGADPAYFVAFCMTEPFLLQKRREISNTGISYNSETAIKAFRVPLPHPDVQAYVGNKVRQAEALRAKSRENRLMVEEIFNLFSAVPNSNRVWHVEPDNLHSYRLNANHYIPLVLETIQRVRLSHGTKTLKEILNERKLGGGETPKGAVYGENGVCFLRVQNVKPWKISRLDAVFIDSKTDNKLKRSRCIADDVVLSITGYPGTAALVTEQDLPANINQHSVRFGVIWPAGYVVAALNSKFVQSQVSRLVIGETREALDYPSVLDLHIPVIATEQMYDIDFQVKTTIFMEQCAETLIKSARFLVEALIERKVTEADLIAAHNDQAVDRGLMQRLTVDGLDVPGAAPLFGDLDRLQTLIAEISPPEGGSDEL